MPSVKLQNPNIDVDWFKTQLERKKLTVRGLAKLMDLNPSTVSLMLRGIRAIHNEDAIKLADAFSVTATEIFKRAGAPIQDEARSLPVTMYVDEHDRVLPISIEAADEFRAPYDTPTNAYAVQVRTGRKYDGWMLVVSGNKLKPDECVGSLVVYCTHKGEIDIGMLRRGYIKNTYNVMNDMSTHEGKDKSLTQNIEVLWCQQVIWIKPSSQ